MAEPSGRSKCVNGLLQGSCLSPCFSPAPRASRKTGPTSPSKVIVPFAAAGTTDRLGRLAAEELSKAFRQQFYVENRVGGGGVVGAAQVARADPDGYTLMIGGYGSHVFGPATLPNVGYDPLADFTHIAMIGGESFILVAHPALGVRSFAELTQLAASRTGRSTWRRPAKAPWVRWWSSSCAASPACCRTSTTFRIAAAGR